jgi:4'-phosphopantetheinyl transferase
MTDFDVPNQEVHVWWSSLEASDSQIEKLRRVLSADEQRRADRFRIEAVAYRFIAARAGLRTLLGRATGTKPADVEFAYGENGKPRLAGGGPRFNASDTGDFVAVALSRTEVGIDVELVRPLRRRDGLARRICTDGELEAFGRFPEEQRDAELLRLWTCKEAALKAIGIGLRGGARNVEVAHASDGSARLAGLLGENNAWTLLQPELAPRLLCSVVIKGSGLRTVAREFSIHSL